MLTNYKWDAFGFLTSQQKVFSLLRPLELSLQGDQRHYFFVPAGARRFRGFLADKRLDLCSTIAA